MITSQQCLKRFGDPEKETNMVLWDVPEDINKAIPTIPNKIYCNQLLVKPLETAFRKMMAKGLQFKTWDGCFNIRNKRGLNSLSLHSWGLAIDVDAAWNGLGKPATLNPEIVKCFKDSGFDWGGDWQRTDGMHLELRSF